MQNIACIEHSETFAVGAGMPISLLLLTKLCYAPREVPAVAFGRTRLEAVVRRQRRVPDSRALFSGKLAKTQNQKER